MLETVLSHCAHRLRRVYLLESLTEYDIALRELHTVKVQRVVRGKLDELAGGTLHQGVLFDLEPLPDLEVGDLLVGEPGLLVLLDEVVDPQNFGGILRVADAAGAGGVIMTERRSAPLSPAARKASAGASELVPIARSGNLQRTIEELKQHGYWTVGTAGGEGESLFSFKFPEKCALILGSEGFGMRRLTRESCDFVVALPMFGRLESLNVSQAAAVFMFEYQRQIASVRK